MVQISKEEAEILRLGCKSQRSTVIHRADEYFARQDALSLAKIA